MDKVLVSTFREVNKYGVIQRDGKILIWCWPTWLTATLMVFDRCEISSIRS